MGSRNPPKDQPKEVKSLAVERPTFLGCAAPWTVFGTAVLLLSWTTQEFVFEHFDSVSRSLDTANQRYSNAYNASLQYQTLYFSSAVATNRLNEASLTKAAQENSAGFAASLEPLPIGQDEKDRTVSWLMNKASSVKDLDSFNEYMGAVNKEDQAIFPLRIKYRKSIEKSRTIASWCYLLPYLFGTICVCRGLCKGE